MTAITNTAPMTIITHRTVGGMVGCTTTCGAGAGGTGAGVTVTAGGGITAGTGGTGSAMVVKVASDHGLRLPPLTARTLQ